MLEVRGQEAVDQAADVGRLERAAFQHGVGLVQQGLDDAGIGRRAADAVFFEGLHQAGFGVARRRLGEVLLAQDVLERHALAFGQRRQLRVGFVFVVLFLVLAFLVHQQEAGIDHGGAGGAERVLRAGGQLHADGVERGRDHLAGHRALPDQLVQAAFVVAQELADLRRRAAGEGGADGFVRFLRVLGFRLVDVRFRRQVVFAVFLADHLAQLAQGFGREAGGVGTHVADQADGAFGAHGHAFVQLLRHLHGLLGGEAELARGLLLQGGGDERRRRTALAFLAHYLGHLQRAARGGLQARQRGLGGLAVGDGELLEFGAVQLHAAGVEALAFLLQLGGERPVLAADEGFDLVLAFADQAQRRRLHAAGRQPVLDLAPQDRRQVEADQVVERAPRLVGVHQVAGDLARVFHRVRDRLRGDLGEHHPVQGLALQQVLLVQDLADVPGDGLALAVRVGRQIDGVGVLGGLGDGVHVLLVLLLHLVAHREAVVDVDRAVLAGQVADMAVRRQDQEVLAQVFIDRLGLGRRLDNQQVLCHVALRKIVRYRSQSPHGAGWFFFIKAPSRGVLSSAGVGGSV